MMLPDKPTPPKRELWEHSLSIFGPAKRGKTRLGSKVPKSVFLSTEPGQNAIECYKVTIDSWSTFLSACNELARGDHDFRSIIIDSIDGAWQLCSQHICERNRVACEADLPYGRGYALVLTEFQRVLNRLAQLNYGLVLLGQSELEEVKTPTGSYHRNVPCLKDKARRFVSGLVDFLFFADLETLPGPDGKPVLQPVLRTKASLLWDSGDRTGLLPPTIPMSYPALVAAFEEAMAARDASDSLNQTQSQGEEQ